MEQYTQQCSSHSKCMFPGLIDLGMVDTPLSSILLILFVTLLNYSWAETHLETKLTHLKNNLRSILAKYDQLKKENGVLKVMIIILFI